MAETRSFVRIGQRKVPIDRWEKNYTLKASDGGGLSIIQPLRMLIDYVGPTGSFAAQTYSFADVLNNKIPTENFRDKYVLIGATAATLGSGSRHHSFIRRMQTETSMAISCPAWRSSRISSTQF